MFTESHTVLSKLYKQFSLKIAIPFFTFRYCIILNITCFSTFSLFNFDIIFYGFIKLSIHSLEI